MPPKKKRRVIVKELQGRTSNYWREDDEGLRSSLLRTNEEAVQTKKTKAFDPPEEEVKTKKTKAFEPPEESVETKKTKAFDPPEKEVQTKKTKDLRPSRGSSQDEKDQGKGLRPSLLRTNWKLNNSRMASNKRGSSQGSIPNMDEEGQDEITIGGSIPRRHWRS